MTRHALHATSISFLFEAGFQKELESTKSGHRDPRAALSYLNIDSNIGKSMENSMFAVSKSHSVDKSHIPQEQNKTVLLPMKDNLRR